MADNFAKNLATLIINERMSREEIARKVGLPKATILRILNHQHKPVIQTRKQICQKMGVSFETMQHGILPEKKMYIDYVPVQKRLAKNLTRYFEEKKITCTELANKSGVSRRAVWLYANEKVTNPSLTQIRALAGALEISVGQLLN